MPFRRYVRGFAVTIAIGVYASSTAMWAQERWATYANPRFGTTADYPADLFTLRDPPPENGDGQSFRTADGRARLSIYGAHNADGDTPQSYVDKYVDLQGAVVSLKRVTARFYVVSGTRERSIFYERCNFPSVADGIVDCLTVTYPPQEKTAWDPVVTRLSRSLRAGRGVGRR